MPAYLLATFLPPPGQPWLIPLVGILSAALALVMARSLSARRRAAAAADGAFVERRQSPRRGGPPVQVYLSDQDAKAAPVTAWIQNRSLGGLCLAVPRQFEIGEILSVRAAAASASIPWVQVEVKYCYLREESWLIGCKFVFVPSWSVMVTFD
jgi:hypothetical protein